MIQFCDISYQISPFGLFSLTELIHIYNLLKLYKKDSSKVTIYIFHNIIHVNLKVHYLQGRKVFITPNVKPDKEMITSLVKAVRGQVFVNYL